MSRLTQLCLSFLTALSAILFVVGLGVLFQGPVFADEPLTGGGCGGTCGESDGSDCTVNLACTPNYDVCNCDQGNNKCNCNLK